MGWWECNDTDLVPFTKKAQFEIPTLLLEIHFYCITFKNDFAFSHFQKIYKSKTLLIFAIKSQTRLILISREVDINHQVAVIQHPGAATHSQHPMALEWIKYSECVTNLRSATEVLLKASMVLIRLKAAGTEL